MLGIYNFIKGLKMQKEREKYFEEYRKKTKRVNITFTNKEYEQLKKRAEKFNLTPTEYIKKSYLAYHKNIYLVPQNLENLLNDLLIQIRGIANNINQVAYAFNSSKGIIFQRKKLEFNLVDLKNKIDDFIKKPKLEKKSKINED